MRETHLLSSSKKFSNKIERWKGGRRGELRPSERNTVNGVVHSAVTGEEKEIKFPYSSISIHFTHGSRFPLPFVQTILSSSPPILSIYPDKFPNFNGENRTKLSNCFPTHRIDADDVKYEAEMFPIFAGIFFSIEKRVLFSY